MNIHPIVVHFPIALWVTACLFEIGHWIFNNESLNKTAIHIAWVAVFFSPIAVGTGLLEEQRLHLNHPILNQHKNFAFMVLGISLAILPVLKALDRKPSKFLKIIFFVCLILATIGVVLTGFYGGKLVFEYGVGVAP